VVAVAGVLLLWDRFLLLGGVAFGVVLVLDMLDGAVARLRHQVSPWGATLDATLDRVTDGLFVLGVALYVDSPLGWGLAVLAVALGNSVSYAKAKGDLEGLLHGKAQPSRTGHDLFERTERFVVLYVAILADVFGLGTGDLEGLEVGLAVLVVGSMVTLGQRLWRARRALA
jgi:CDP-diacylglycerol--glycerol-3-phosphate 3-phosphatidyltransferase